MPVISGGFHHFTTSRCKHDISFLGREKWSRKPFLAVLQALTIERVLKLKNLSHELLLLRLWRVAVLAWRCDKYSVSEARSVKNKERERERARE